mgnify:CR=1 FL=1
MKRFILLSLSLIPLIAACSNVKTDEKSSEPSINSSISSQDLSENSSSITSYQNFKTIDYRNINENDIHPEVDEGFVKISHLKIGQFDYDAFDDEKNYLYQLSCKDKSDSFKNHRFDNADGDHYYVELSEKQNNYIPNGFEILWNSNTKGSAVEITIDNLFKCITYREVFYSESKNMAKVVYYDHVIPGLEEAKVAELKGVLVDIRPYVDESKVKSGIDGAFEFNTGIEIEYIDLSDIEYQIVK